MKLIFRFTPEKTVLISSSNYVMSFFSSYCGTIVSESGPFNFESLPLDTELRLALFVIMDDNVKKIKTPAKRE